MKYLLVDSNRRSTLSKSYESDSKAWKAEERVSPEGAKGRSPLQTALTGKVDA
jgi:hypothetical protein